MNKSEVIREALKANPDKSVGELSEMLGKQHTGEVFATNLIHAVKFKLNKVKQEKKKKLVVVPKPMDNLIDNLDEVKALAVKVGGRENLVRLATLVAA